MSIDSSFVRVYNGQPDQGGDFIGTAFFISPQKLLTAAHVAKQCSSGIFLRNMPDGGTEKIPVNKIEYGNTDYGDRDFAILQTAKYYSIVNILLPSSRKPLCEDDAVVLRGFYNESGGLHSRDGKVSNFEGNYNCWAISGGVHKAMSGGAVLENTGNTLVGLIFARHQQDKITTYMIPVDEFISHFVELSDSEFATLKHRIRQIGELTQMGCNPKSAQEITTALLDDYFRGNQ